jgi:hypothetical protein
MVAVLLGTSASLSAAQAPAPPQAADGPSIRIGATLYTDYTYTDRPQATDTDGNRFHPSQFNVTRAYLNLNGTLSRLVGFRITPDIARETGSGSSLNGSLTFRIKYAYAQLNLDDWMPRGSWARLGIQHTPLVEFDESIYRYRFQGTVFVERDGYLSSSDAGASIRLNLPSDYGEIHAGIYNGETYSKAEVNDQKAWQVRGTLRPFAKSAPLRGLRVTGFYDGDHLVKNGEQTRAVIGATYEHRFANAGYQHLNATDQASISLAEIDGQGYTVWVTPKVANGWEGLLRFDRLTPNTSVDLRRRRNIAGVAYWPKMQGPVTTAILFDVESVTAKGAAAAATPDQRRLAVHALVQF